MAQGGKERITEELLEQLLASSTPEAYLASEGATVERDLPDYLSELLEERGIRRSDVVRASGLNATVVYDIFSGKSRPGHDHAVMLAFGLGCNLREAQRLLRLAGVSELWCKVPRDAILIWCFEHGLSREETDDELYRLGKRPFWAPARCVSDGRPLDDRPVCGFCRPSIQSSTEDIPSRCA